MTAEERQQGAVMSVLNKPGAPFGIVVDYDDAKVIRVCVALPDGQICETEIDPSNTQALFLLEVIKADISPTEQAVFH